MKKQEADAEYKVTEVVGVRKIQKIMALQNIFVVIIYIYLNFGAPFAPKSGMFKTLSSMLNNCQLVFGCDMFDNSSAGVCCEWSGPKSVLIWMSFFRLLHSANNFNCNLVPSVDAW